nr:response regulator [Eubacterium sp.]
MEFLKYNEETQEKYEKLTLFLFSLYSSGMAVLSAIQGWEIWLVVLILLMMVMGWGVYVFHARNYPFRASVVAIGAHISVTLYACHVDNLFPILMIVVALGIIMALYVIPELMWINVLTTVVLIFYHIVVIETIQAKNLLSSGNSIFFIFNVFLMQYLIYFWVKKRQEGNREFLRLSMALADAERSKHDFLANVSHEIRTPVNTICGMSELAQEEDNIKKMQEAMFDIQSAGRNLLSVVSDVLDFSELQSGKMELEEEEYNISSTINDIINMTMARKNQKNLELVVDCNADLPACLMGDEKKIRRVIMNIVNNAIKFTNEGGVCIGLDFRRESYGINLIVTVKDTGIGMLEENIEKLFSSFNQVDTKRNRQEGGIGLGLAISQALVEKMGGVLNIRSKLGKGTTVRIVIPQKVVEDRPIARLEHTENLHMATYIDMEQFRMRSIRDAYSASVFRMAAAMQVRTQNCRNLADLKRKESKETFTHIITSIAEYQQDPAYFDEVAKRTNVVVILEREEERKLTNPDIVRLYKPFYILSIMQVLKRGNVERESLRMTHQRKFIAPDVKVLVVDDNAMNIRVMEGLLKRYQIAVTRATSGHEALKLIESRDYDFVFMDHMMPEMDGVETFHRIRSKHGIYYREVPIVALTADAVAGSRERFLEEGFDDFVEKPVELSVLERVLLRIVSPTKIKYIEEEQEERLAEEVSKELPQEETRFAVGDLDVEKGLTYCGDQEKYLEALAESFVTAGRDQGEISRCFAEQQWKDYTIKVHALKSGMLSIGAVALSEQAKALEAAGRNEDIPYIKANHEALMEQWNRVIEMIGKDPQVPVEEAKERLGIVGEEEAQGGEDELGEKEVADDTMWEQWMIQLEDATFSLDDEKMLLLLKEMQGYSYLGKSLEQPLKPAIRKVEMSDLISAYESVSGMREQWQKGGE